MLLNTFSRNKRRKNSEESSWEFSKCPFLTLSRVNVKNLSSLILDAKISLVPTHQLIVPSTLLAPATEI